MTPPYPFPPSFSQGIQVFWINFLSGGHWPQLFVLRYPMPLNVVGVYTRHLILEFHAVVHLQIKNIYFFFNLQLNIDIIRFPGSHKRSSGRKLLCCLVESIFY